MAHPRDEVSRFRCYSMLPPILTFLLNEPLQPLRYISKASLAAIIIVSVVKMFNYNMPIQLWKVSKIDLVPWALSFFGCTFLGIEYGVTAGAIANMLLLVYFQARPTHVVMWRDQKGTPRALNAIAEGSTGAVQNGNHDLVSKPSDTNASKTVVCKIGGSILYPVGGEWKKVLENALASCKCTAVVLDFTHVARIDYGGLTVSDFSLLSSLNDVF